MKKLSAILFAASAIPSFASDDGGWSYNELMGTHRQGKAIVFVFGSDGSAKATVGNSGLTFKTEVKSDGRTVMTSKISGVGENSITTNVEGLSQVERDIVASEVNKSKGTMEDPFFSNSTPVTETISLGMTDNQCTLSQQNPS